MQSTKLTVTSREGLGRNAARRTRHAGRVPAIVYSRHASPAPVTLESAPLKRLLKEMGDAAVVVEIEGASASPAMAIIKDVQKDPLTDRIIHVDFQEVKPDEKIEMDVAVRVVGEPYGVKNQNGILDIVSHTLRVRCLPKDLPRYIEVDVTELRVGENLHVSEIKPPLGVEIRTARSQSVVACTEAVGEVVAAQAAAAPEATASQASDAKSAAPAATEAKTTAAASGGEKKPAAAAGDKKAPAKK